jgi:hypothetical protein
MAGRLHYERRVLRAGEGINPENGAVEWPGEVDLDPKVCRDAMSPRPGIARAADLQARVATRAPIAVGSAAARGHRHSSTETVFE